MTALTAFSSTVLLIAMLATMYNFKDCSEMYAYFKTRRGKKVLKGIIIFIAFGLGTASISDAIAEEYEFFDYGEVYLGIDSTRNTSPQCGHGEYSERMTSNGGLRVNLIKSKNDLFEFNVKYTHHSCAFNDDINNYDALGVEAVYKLW